VPAGGLPLLIEEEGHVVSEAYRIRGDLMTGSKKGDPEADYLKAIELARLQGRACVPRPAMLCSAALDGSTQAR
jgi:hypothetical protein